MSYIKSKNINIYPASARSNSIDRLNIEHNMINIVNRLTDIDSFIISGLDVQISNNKIMIKPGACNIHGYYVSIKNENNDPYDTGIAAEAGVVQLKLTFNTTPILDTAAIQLNGTDAAGEYTGLSIDVANTPTITPTTITIDNSSMCILPIAQIIKKDNSYEIKKLNNILKLDTRSIKVSQDSQAQTQFSAISKKAWTDLTSLNDLLTNFMVDDGELN